MNNNLGFMIEITPMIMKIIELVLSNEPLCKLIYFNTEDCMDEILDEDCNLLFNNVFPFPKITGVLTEDKNILNIWLYKVSPNKNNDIFNDVIIAIDIICNISSWKIDGGIRPYLIANKIDELLNGKMLDETFAKIALEDMQYKSYSEDHHGFRMYYSFKNISRSDR